MQTMPDEFQQLQGLESDLQEITWGMPAHCSQVSLKLHDGRCHRHSSRPDMGSSKHL